MKSVILKQNKAEKVSFDELNSAACARLYKVKYVIDKNPTC